MTNTYALTDYDVYDDEDYDNFGGRRRRRRRARKRRRKIISRRKRNKPPLGRPPIYIKRPPMRSIPRRIKRKPRIIRGKPMRLPPIKVKRSPVKTVVIRPTSRPAPFIKPVPMFVKKKAKPMVKRKTPINHLIKKTNPKVIKSTISKQSKAVIKDIKQEQIQATKKAMASDGKSSKLIKIVAIVGAVGITGFGIYKFIKNKQTSNGHISTNK